MSLFYRILILFTLQLGIRVSLWLHFSVLPDSLLDLNGISGDLAVAMLAGSIPSLIPVHRKTWQSWCFVAMATFVAVLSFSNYEVVRTTGSNIQIQHLVYLNSPTLIRGSVFAASQLVLLAVLLTFIGLVYLIERVILRQRTPVKLWQATVTIIIGAILFVVMSYNYFVPGVAYWRQYNVLVGTVRTAGFLISTRSLRENDQNPLAYEQQRSRDLSGQLLIDRQQIKDKPNILLVIVEGASGARHPAEMLSWDFHRFASFYYLSERGLRVRNFVALNRQTNRGEFSLLCGQFPNLVQGAAKMDMYLAEEHGACLPEALSKQGYHTVYLQAAKLEFMNKTRFMPEAGFALSHGAEALPIEPYDSEWGANDRTFFTAAADEINALNELSEQPWMLTLLTVGTHHPYGIDPNFKSRFTKRRHEHAMAFLDSQLLDFLLKLERQGQLEDTLLIVTADESAGTGHEATDSFTQHWLPLYMAGPGIPANSTNDGMFHTADLALSVMDYALGQSSSDSFKGRSLFRSYAEPRPQIPFGNTYLRSAGMLLGQSHAVLCNDDLKGCRNFQFPEQLFWPALAADHDQPKTDPLQHAIRANDWLPGD